MIWELLAGALFIFGLFFGALGLGKRKLLPDTLPEPQNGPLEPVSEPTEEIPPPPPPDPKEGLSWEDPKGAFKLTRILCDEEGLTFVQKNTVCASIYQESRFRNRYADGRPVINENRKDGKVWSVDWGIVQVNDTPGWHIGPGLRFPSVEYVMDHPEEAVRWMVQHMKRTSGLQPWSSWTTGAYRQWLSPESPMWALRD